jgi:hypothetical protein
MTTKEVERGKVEMSLLDLFFIFHFLFVLFIFVIDFSLNVRDTGQKKINRKNSVKSHYGVSVTHSVQITPFGSLLQQRTMKRGLYISIIFK